jgi:hypothetical protein
MSEFESTTGEKLVTEVCVLYDPRTGRIVHLHEFIGDGTGLWGPDAKDERERLTVEGAKRRHKDVDRLKALHVPRNVRMEPHVVYGVDLQSGKLVPRANLTEAAIIARRERRPRRPAE